MTAVQRQPVGDLVGGMAPLCLKEAPTLPLQLASRAEQVDYGSEVEEALQRLPCPSLLEERKAVGSVLRSACCACSNNWRYGERSIQR